MCLLAPCPIHGMSGSKMMIRYKIFGNETKGIGDKNTEKQMDDQRSA